MMIKKKKTKKKKSQPPNHPQHFIFLGKRGGMAEQGANKNSHSQ